MYESGNITNETQGVPVIVPMLVVKNQKKKLNGLIETENKYLLQQFTRFNQRNNYY